MKKYIVHRLCWDFEKEERWLNEMAAKGMNFIDFTFARYLFVKGTPGEYLYRIELLPQRATHPESQVYIEFMESVGVEFMGKWVNWVYFRKKASEGPFEIFTDYASKISHYKRVSWFFGMIAALNFFAFFYNVIWGSIAASEYNNHYLSHIFPLVLLNGVAALGFSWLIIGYIRKVSRLKKEKQLHE